MANEQFLREARWVLHLQWAAFNTLAWLAGVVLVGLIFQRELNNALSLAVLGLFLGVGQGLILRGRLSLTLWGWVALTGVGAALGQSLSQLLVTALGGAALEDMIASLVGAIVLGSTLGTIFGLCLGGVQWLWLRRFTSLAQAWILISILGWAAGMGLAAALPLGPLTASMTSVVVSSLVTGAWVRQLLHA